MLSVWRGQWRALSSGGLGENACVDKKSRRSWYLHTGKRRFPLEGNPPGRRTLLVREIVYCHETIRYVHLSAFQPLPAASSKLLLCAERGEQGPRGPEPARKLTGERHCGVLKSSKDLWVFEVNKCERSIRAAGGFDTNSLIQMTLSREGVSPSSNSHHLPFQEILQFNSINIS